MLFGSKDTFAIEAMLEADLVGPSIWGRMCVWCDGVALGDYDAASCALYPAYLSFKDLLPALASLWEAKLDGLSDNALITHLEGLLYGTPPAGDDDRLLAKYERDAQHYGRYNFLTNWGEQFDGAGKSFIFRKQDGPVRVLSTKHERALEAPVEVVSVTIEEFLRWFEGETERLKQAAPVR